MMAGPRRNGRSREWVSRQHVLISDAKVLEPGLRLYVVETREVGTVRTRLAKTELQVWTPNERPQR
jgi:hypothetical protein